MKTNRTMWAVCAAATLFAGCASHDEMSQKERDRATREMEKADRKEAQKQEKMMREATGQKRAR